MAIPYAGRLDPRYAPRLWWLAMLYWVKVLAVGAHLSAASGHAESLRYLPYPFVWVTANATVVL